MTNYSGNPRVYPRIKRIPVTKRRLIIGVTVVAVVIASIVGLSLGDSRSAPTELVASDWRSNWSVEKGFNLTIDAEGFRIPTAFAFVLDPGDLPKDPLYFVTELHGAVKVVTNDRTVFTFAENFFNLKYNGDLPIISEEVGMAGICLDQQRGYLFVTFAYHDSGGIVRNNIVRFESTPRTFSIAPTSQIDFTQVFATHPSAASHQIGPCQVKDDLLYIAVGDGHQIQESQQVDSFLGKIIRMTLDGLPAPSNPFYEDGNIGNAGNYIWASGLRNPFGLKIVGDQLFVADNGPNIDRFLHVEEGGNYLWDGTNMSIGTNAAAVFSPGRGVAQLDHYPPDTMIFPDRFKDNFFVAMTGNSLERLEGLPAIWVIPYMFAQEPLSAVARPLLRYRGHNPQVVSGLGVGPDGLYFAPLFPDSSGFSQVLKLSFAAEAQYPFTIEEELNPLVLMSTHGCLACHSLIEGEDENLGPTLAHNALVSRLEVRLNSEEYSRTVKELDKLDSEPNVSFQDARRAVAQAQDLEKIKLWLYFRILEPKFDDPYASMPRLNLSGPQAQAIVDYLSKASEDPTEDVSGQTALSKFTQMGYTLVRPVADRLPYPTRKNALLYGIALLGIGIFIGAMLLAFSFWLVSYRGRKRNSRVSG